ncbi:hypothetical protein B1A99_11750 [Cohnella sp. CIP 111063]|uniref:DUF5695 domain-containing protein n=1 Tax=unclassified Cohnella TaxID=2636738 RepID=UPI000B8BB563|nr:MULTISPECIES: DUF5695 domain-containing protein [unclassified Cohnella]OXS59290.1 hypothetical protein B1A99_11750 [Cohnella sp. CIP 111063]PRX72313.1 concanavalin A-like lectin/glucanase superfamily protein [Cohnella sp. SGD-V74]
MVQRLALVQITKRVLLLSALLGAALLCVALLPQSASAYTLSNGTFEVQTGTHGEITSLKIVGDNYPTNYVMNATNAPQQNTADHQWVGELMFKYRLGTGAWQTALTQSSADGRTQNQSGTTATITYQNSANANGVKNFRLVETYSLVNDYFLWQIQLTNTSAQTIEFGDIGLPLPFNEYWSGGGNEQIYETRVVTHSFVGNNSSYITVGRPSGIGPYLLMVPDVSTGAGFEYQDRWRIEEHPGSMWAADQGGWPEGLNVFYIHSNVIKSTNRGYLPNTSLTLAPGASKTYAFKFFKVANENAVKDRLYSEGMIDVTAIPGMIVPTNQTAKFDLHTSKAITSITAQYPSETTITSLGTTGTNHKLYSLKMNRLGPNLITVNYGSGEKTVLQFYAIEPIADALQRHSTFMVNSTQWNVPGDIRDKVFDDWMMHTNSKRNVFNGYWGWGDDWGYTHGQFLAEKNVQTPVASEVTAVDQYLQTAIWTNLMANNHTDYLIHDFLMPAPNTTPTYRGYAYPHIYNTYFSMYKIAKLYPDLISYTNTRQTYLSRAYNIFKALYDGPVAYNWHTGLMGEQTTPELIKALQDEGMTAQANDVIAKMATKYNNFKNTTYPYGSEYNYDNTGEEAVYMLAKMNNNTSMMSKINAKTRATRGHMPVWYYYADPVTITGENWWNFQYSVSLVGYAMDDWVRNYSANPEVEQRMTYAAKIANVSAINSGQISSDPADIGAVAWTYQAEKGNYPALGLGGGPLQNGWRGMSGEADLGLFGAIRILSSDVAIDPIFGLYCYGCDVTESGGNYIIVPKDGVNQKLNLITQKLNMTMERDKYTAATVALAKNYVNFTLQSATPGKAHTTKVTFTGLAAGTYQVLVDNAVVGSVNATTGGATTVNLGIGTAPSYDIKLQQGGVSLPEQLVRYPFSESNGTSTADASGNGKTGTLNGGATFSAGQSGNAVALNGTNGYVSMPSGIANGATDVTIAAWVKANSLSNWTRIFDIGTGTSNYMFLSPQPGGAGLRFAITTGGNGAEQQIHSTAAFPTGVWKHVAVTIAGSTGRLYVDGVQVAANASMTLNPSSLGNTTQNWLGRSQFAGDPYFNGQIDDFRIYSRALSASEIGTLYGGTTISDIAPQATATTSFVSSWESLAGLNDGYTPVSSNDRGHPVYGNWDNPNTTQWVQYTWSSARTISSVDVYWFDDDQGIDLPASYTIQYWDGSSWVNVSGASGLGLLANQYNTTTFAPVTTTQIRLNITAKATTSTGIESWRANGY